MSRLMSNNLLYGFKAPGVAAAPPGAGPGALARRSCLRPAPRGSPDPAPTRDRPRGIQGQPQPPEAVLRAPASDDASGGGAPAPGCPRFGWRAQVRSWLRWGAAIPSAVVPGRAEQTCPLGVQVVRPVGRSTWTPRGQARSTEVWDDGRRDGSGARCGFCGTSADGRNRFNDLS
jgi:hypothetical protein